MTDIRTRAAEAARELSGMSDSDGYGLDEYASLIRELAGMVPEWRPISEAPRVYAPPLSIYNHHAPFILGLWGRAFYSVCQWGGPSKPAWIGGDNKPVPFQPTRWMPLPLSTEDGGLGEPPPPTPEKGGEG